MSDEARDKDGKWTVSGDVPPLFTEAQKAGSLSRTPAGDPLLFTQDQKETAVNPWHERQKYLAARDKEQSPPTHPDYAAGDHIPDAKDKERWGYKSEDFHEWHDSQGRNVSQIRQENVSTYPALKTMDDSEVQTWAEAGEPNIDNDGHTAEEIRDDNSEYSRELAEMDDDDLVARSNRGNVTRGLQSDEEKEYDERREQEDEDTPPDEDDEDHEPGSGGEEVEVTEPTSEKLKSKARVFINDPESVEPKLKKLIKTSPASVKDIVGAPDRDNVIMRDDGWEGVKVTVHGPEWANTGDYHIRTDPNGKPYLYYDYIVLKGSQQGKGVGSKMFSESVEAAQKAGLDHIALHAAGNVHNGTFNGYYTWPRYGFDADLNDPDAMLSKTAERTKAAFPDAKTIQDVFSTPEGQTWWKQNGSDLFHMKFDLTPGSRSMKVYTAYMAARKAMGR